MDVVSSTEISMNENYLLHSVLHLYIGRNNLQYYKLPFRPTSLVHRANVAIRTRPDLDLRIPKSVLLSLLAAVGL